MLDAIDKNDFPLAQRLIANKANVNERNPNHRVTPLWLTVHLGGRDKIFEALLVAKANVNQDSVHFQTPLGAAVIMSQFEYAKKLILANADVNLAYENTATPLQLCFTHWEETHAATRAIGQLLLNSGAKTQCLTMTMTRMFCTQSEWSDTNHWLEPMIEKRQVTKQAIIAVAGVLGKRWGIYRDVVELVAETIWTMHVKQTWVDLEWSEKMRQEAWNK